MKIIAECLCSKMEIWKFVLLNMIRSLLLGFILLCWLSDDGTLLNNRIVLKDHDITKEQFLELLYQIYRTGRPISSNLENLSIAATKLDCEFILWKLCRFMAGNSDELNFIEKVKKL
uniref:Uncharacterized protein n=1 Tax=Meloidogyne incognita TaxID=6306 RepID=A0A914NZ88_MELIC